MSRDNGAKPCVHTYCALFITRCGAVAIVEDGRFARLEPDPSHPTGQALCAEGRAAPEIVYSRQRLTHPLRRTRHKGDPDPGWEQINSTGFIQRLGNALGAPNSAISLDVCGWGQAFATRYASGVGSVGTGAAAPWDPTRLGPKAPTSTG